MHRLILSLVLFASLLPAQGVVVRRRVVATAGGEPTFTHIQSHAGTTVSAGSTASVTLTSTPTDGNAVACLVFGYNGTLSTLGITSVMDNAGTPNTYVATPNSGVYANASARKAWLYYLLNVPSGAGATITVTFNQTLTYDSGIECDEFHRSAGTWTLDTDASGSGTGSTLNTPGITPSVAGELLYGVASLQSSVTADSAATWTVGLNVNHVFTEYIVSGAGGATTMNATLSGSGTWNSVAAAFK